MAQKLEAQGNKAGVDKWDDGSDHDNVTKIHIRAEPQGIHYIRFDYIKSGQVKFGLFHRNSNPGVTQTFEINHFKGEELVSVEGYYDPNSKVILGLQFKTNLRISELIGYAKNGTKFVLAVEGKKIIGFHGSSDSHLNSLGAYFTKFASAKLVAKGGKGGKEWDDGDDHDGVTKISVRGGSTGVQYIQVDYVNDGKQILGSIHGVRGEGFTEEFEIDHLKKEYLVSVEGYYDQSGVIQGLQFKTNLKTSELMGDYTGRKFILAKNGEKIIGFHGYAEKNLNSLGAYFTTSPSPFTKSECHGDGTYGDLWDDGTFKGIRKVYVHYQDGYVPGVRIHYDNNEGKVETYEHGFMDGQVGEFEVDNPNEFITSVEGTMYTDGHTWFRSLTFKTSTGRTSPTFGTPFDNKFVLESKGCHLVGFFGRSNSREIYALGAHFAPLPSTPDVKKVEPVGGDGGSSWDDGGFDGIRNIYIGHSESGVAFIKFIYDKDNHAVVGDDHGSKTVNGVDEFKLEYPSEYLTSVEGSYDKESGVIRMLRFKTNMKTSRAFGLKKGESFILEKEGHEITGFYGKASDMLHQIGIHVLPIAE